MTVTEQVHIALALERAGWHPAAWRERRTTGRPVLPATGATSCTPPSTQASSSRRSRMRSDCRPSTRPTTAPTVSADVSTPCSSPRTSLPLTRRIGLVPTVTTTHPEPFHVATGCRRSTSRAAAGPAGARVGGSPQSAPTSVAAPRASTRGPAPAGRDSDRDPCGVPRGARVRRGARRLWDSWEDDAIIQDAATGRFVDRGPRAQHRLRGRALLGQGGLDRAALTSGPPPRHGARAPDHPLRARRGAADLVFVTPHNDDDVAAILAELDADAAVLRTDGRSAWCLRRAARPLEDTAVPRAGRADASTSTTEPRRLGRPHLRRHAERLVDASSPGPRSARRRPPPPRPPAADLVQSPSGWCRSPAGRCAARRRPERHGRHQDELRERYTAAPRQPLRTRGGRPVAEPARCTWPRTSRGSTARRSGPTRLPEARSTSTPSSTSPALPSAAGSTTCSSPRACGCASTRGAPRTRRVGRPNTLAVLAALAAVTEHVGLVGTLNATFNEPYELARQLSTLDHLSDGRAGWNVVTSSDAFHGANFRRGGFLDHADRYERARRVRRASRRSCGTAGPPMRSRPMPHRGCSSPRTRPRAFGTAGPSSTSTRRFTCRAAPGLPGDRAGRRLGRRARLRVPSTPR